MYKHGAQNGHRIIDDRMVKRVIEGRKNTSDSYMWVYSTGKYAKHPIRIFEYQPGRNGQYPQKFLKGFSGYLHSDAYSGYQKVEKITRCLCYSHLRRKFVDALPKDIRSPDATLPPVMVD